MRLDGSYPRADASSSGPPCTLWLPFALRDLVCSCVSRLPFALRRSGFHVTRAVEINFAGVNAFGPRQDL
jgi:hypothetical protein